MKQTIERRHWLSEESDLVRALYDLTFANDDGLREAIKRFLTLGREYWIDKDDPNLGDAWLWAENLTGIAIIIQHHVTVLKAEITRPCLRAVESKNAH